MKSVAIYGFSQPTREQVHDSTASEVWTLNDAYKRDAPMERVTRWYEMHPYEWLMDEHKDWLRRPQPFPVYMLKRFDEFPCSIEYPLSCISEFDGERLYYTSSIAFMLAHAIANDYGRIELYGVDMRTGTEYDYQKACTEYMLGVAIGRDIEVYVPPESALLKAPLYAYDADTQTIGTETLELHYRHYKERMDAFTEYVPLFFVYDGAQAQIQLMQARFMNAGVVKRQTAELQRLYVTREFQAVNSQYNFNMGKLAAFDNLSITDERLGAVRHTADELYQRMFQLDGAVQAMKNIMSHMDLKGYELDLVSSLSA